MPERKIALQVTQATQLLHNVSQHQQDSIIKRESQLTTKTMSVLLDTTVLQDQTQLTSSNALEDITPTLQHLVSVLSVQ